MDSSDKDLLINYTKGNQVAFDRFYLRHKDTLWRQALSKVKNIDTAEDVYSTFFKNFIDKLLNKQDFIEDIFRHNKESALPYMMVMVRNTSLDFHRSKQKKDDHETQSARFSDEETDFPDMAYNAETNIEEIYFDIKKLIWREYNQLIKKEKFNQQAIGNFEKKRLEKEIDKANGSATQQELIFDLLYIQRMTLTSVAQSVGIDRKTLNIRRKKLEVLLGLYFSDEEVIF